MWSNKLKSFFLRSFFSNHSQQGKCCAHTQPSKERAYQKSKTVTQLRYCLAKTAMQTIDSKFIPVGKGEKEKEDKTYMQKWS